jgi:hypothetical protein
MVNCILDLRRVPHPTTGIFTRDSYERSPFPLFYRHATKQNCR